MEFTEVLEKVLKLLQRQGRASYRALKLRFQLNDEFLAAIKEEILFAHAEQVKEEGPGLVWTDNSNAESRGQRPESEQVQGPPSKVQNSKDQPLPPHPQPLAERRQLTVMFCDLVGSTALSTQLDPEDLRAVVRQYQQTCAEVIQRHDGYIAQYLGDGLLVYFGYPTAHEDDARRAVRTGLEIIQTLRDQVPSPLAGEGQGEGASGKERKLQVRIGIHTGLVVIGDMGGSGRTEQLALGETPNIAARIQGLAEPNTVIISAATQRLIEGQFESQPFGSHLLKGIAAPLAVYHVQNERQRGSHLAGKTTLTPLVGREQEVGLLLDRWEQAKEGRGQVVLLSGEPGIGKSRLAYTLREHVTNEGSLLFEARCSPYHQHSALYPLIEVLQRTLVFTRHDTDAEKVTKLERTLALYKMQDSLSLFTAWLFLPTPATSPPLTLTPQKQKERTLQSLLQVLMAQAERHATVSVWEDLHWADPSSLEFLSLLIEQLPTTKLLLVLTFRPEFTPPWKPRSHISQLVLNRLGKKQVEAMIEQAAAGNKLSAEVIEQIRLKTDGVPLFVEELTKSVVEARGQGPGNGGQGRKAAETLAIPATLQEALLARLDRLSTARQVAQLGATLGREFSHELLQSVAPVSESDLHAALDKLVEAEILYQRGMGEQARYFFKHALIQDTAYQSLLKSTRQQYHQQIAHVLEERFPDIKAMQPEVLAHHYTEAGLTEQAISYWQQAGERAMQRSVFIEAENYFTQGIRLLRMLPEAKVRLRQEARLQAALGGVLMLAKGLAVPEAEVAFARAYELCQQLADPVELFSLIVHLRLYRDARGEIRKALALAKQLLQIAQQVQAPELLLQAHFQLGLSFSIHGEFANAREHLDQAAVLYNPQQYRSHAFFHAIDPQVGGAGTSGLLLWYLGYPDQARQKSREALTFARELAHPPNTVMALLLTSWCHIFCQEEQEALVGLAESILLSAEYGILTHLGFGKSLQGWAWIRQNKAEEGVRQIQEVLSFSDTMGGTIFSSAFLAYQAEGHLALGQSEIGLSALARALEFVERSGERWYEAELYRLRGELTLARSKVQSRKSQVTDPRLLNPDPHGEAEACFLTALDVARKQQAKSLELRAATSLARLWHQQGKRADAHKLLSDVYTWFTEGFDTKDLQEAKALIEELSD